MEKSKARILVVEDKSIVARDIEIRLRGLGYVIAAAATSGEEAVEKAAELRPDLVLMDIMLRGEMDGVEAAQHIHSHFDIPVIYLTAHSDEATLQRAKLTQPFGYILKPFEERELHTTIEMALYRHKMGKQLRESEARFRDLLESAPDPIVIVNSEGRVALVNAQTEKVFGYTREELLGRPLEILVPEGTREAHTALCKVYFADPHTRPMGSGLEINCLRKDGSELPVEISLSPGEMADGPMVTSVIRDITERKRGQEALRESNDRLELVNQISRRLSAILDTDQLMVGVVRLAQDYLGYSHISVALVEGDELVFQVAASGGRSVPIGSRLRIGQGIVGWVAAQGRAVRVLDVTQDARYDPHPALSDTRSKLAVPIQLSDRVLGVLNAESDQPAAFDESDETLLQAIADQLALALQNARSYREAQEQRDEATAVAEALFEETNKIVGMNRVAAALLAVTGLDEAARAFVYGLRDEMGVRKSMLWLVDALQDELRLAAIAGLPPGAATDCWELACAALIHVWHTGQGRTRADWKGSSPAFSAPGSPLEFCDAYFDNWLMLPVKAYNEVLGVLVTEQDALDEDTLRIFVNQAALGLVAARSYEQLEEEKKRSDDLLHVILPDAIIEELKATGRVKPRRYENVAVLFCDIVGFTAYSDQHPPEDVLFYLQRMVEDFEELAVRHALQKIKTTGDAFMAAAGLLEHVDNPVLNCVKCGLEMVATARRLPVDWKVRVGIHVGPVVAGVVGHRRYSFDIWGDTVNTASRVEAHGLNDAVNVSAAAWGYVSNLCRGESLGLIEAKGKGKLELYRVEGLIADEG